MFFGIDLGTTYSVIARVDEKGIPEVITNREGKRLTPSVLMVKPEHGFVVGEVAKDSSIINGKNTISSAKDYMGTVKKFTTDEVVLTPEEVSGLILKKLCSDAEQYCGCTVKDVVLTIPAYFTDAQRKATLDSAHIAGIEVTKMINEPTAAALYYAYTKKVDGALVLIYDLGGGTFDATIALIENKSITVKSTSGIRKIGGRFFDQLIVDYVSEYLLEKYDLDLYDEENIDDFQELYIKAENCKTKLSTVTEASIAIKIGKVKDNIIITRTIFERLIEKFYLRTESSVRIALQDAGLSFNDLDKVLLVGGSSRIPFIMRKLRELTGLEPNVEVNPDEAVAMGAAIFAYLESGFVLPTQIENITDVCSHSLGIVTVDATTKKRVNSIIIERNTVIPAHNKKEFKTAVNNMRSIHLEVTEGEDEDIEYVNIIAEFDIELPPDLQKFTPVNVEMVLDENQVLHIFASKEGENSFYKECHLNRNSNMEDVDIQLKASLISEMKIEAF